MTGDIRWPTGGIAVCTIASTGPRISSDGSGGGLISWAEPRDNSGISRIFYQHLRSDATALFSQNGDTAIASHYGTGISNWCPAVSDGAGGWIFGAGNAAALLSQRVDASGTTQWTQPYLVVESFNDYNIRMLSDVSGGGLFLYPNFIRRVLHDGTMPWGQFERVLTDSTSAHLIDDALSDGDGGAFVALGENNWGYYVDLYVQHVDNLGSRQWGPRGARLSGPGFGTRLTSDGAGGIIAAWQDRRAGYYAIYAQRIDSAGSPVWASNGTIVCHSSGDARDPTIVSDGSGGGIVAWTDGRAGHHIYAQRIDASGRPLWQTDGIPICTAPGAQAYPQAVSAGIDGALVVWQDSRSGTNNDIYAQLVTGDGQVGPPVPPVDAVAVESITATPHYANKGDQVAIRVALRNTGAHPGVVKVQAVVGNGMVNRLPYFLPMTSVYLDAGGAGNADVQWTVPTDAMPLEWLVYAHVYDVSGQHELASRTESAIVVCPAPGCEEAANAATQYALGCLHLDPAWSCGVALFSAVPIAGVLGDGIGYVESACNLQQRAAAGDYVGAAIPEIFEGVKIWGIGTHTLEASVVGTPEGAFFDAVDTPAQLLVGGLECIDAFAYQHLAESGGYGGWITRTWESLEHRGSQRSADEWGWVDSCSVALIVGDVYPRVEADTLRAVPDTTDLHGTYIIHKSPGMSWVFAGPDSVLPRHGHVLKLRGVSDSTFALGLSHRRPDATRQRVDFGRVREVPGALYALDLCDTTSTYLLTVDWEGDGSVDTTLVGAVGGAVGVEESSPLASGQPRVMALHPTQPNPFSTRTEIRFDLPRGGPTSLAIYDVAGRVVRELVSSTLPAGFHLAVWDGTDERGHGVAAGVYFYRLQAEGNVLTRKLVLVR